MKVINTPAITAVVVRHLITNSADGSLYSSGYVIFDVFQGNFRAIKPGESWESTDSFREGAVNLAIGAPDSTFKYEFSFVAAATDEPAVVGDPEYAVRIKQRRKAYYDFESEFIPLLARTRGGQVQVDGLLSEVESLKADLLSRALSAEERSVHEGITRSFVLNLRNYRAAHSSGLVADTEIVRWRQQYEKRRAELIPLLIP